MHPLHNFKLSTFAAATLACAVGCIDDASVRGESGALATIADPEYAEAGDAGSVDGGPSDSGTTVIDGGLDGGTVPNPDGPYFVSVIANGTGCPAGTVNTVITPDGASFSTAFSAYEASINSDTPDLTITKNCVLSIRLHTPRGVSFAVSRFSWGGYAFLEQGVTATMSAYYRFQGSAVSPKTNRITRVGPFDDDIAFRDDVNTADLVWSPCGVDRELIITTQVQLKNSDPKRSGYANITDVPLQGGILLDFQRCAGTSTATSRTAPPAISAGKR